MFKNVLIIGMPICNDKRNSFSDTEWYEKDQRDNGKYNNFSDTELHETSERD